MKSDDINVFNFKKIETMIDENSPNWNSSDGDVANNIATQLAISNKIQLEILKTMMVTTSCFPFTTFRDKASAKEGIDPDTLNKIVSEAPKVKDFAFDINGKKINVYEV